MKMIVGSKMEKIENIKNWKVKQTHTTNIIDSVFFFYFLLLYYYYFHYQTVSFLPCAKNTFLWVICTTRNSCREWQKRMKETLDSFLCWIYLCTEGTHRIIFHFFLILILEVYLSHFGCVGISKLTNTFKFS